MITNESLEQYFFQGLHDELLERVKPDSLRDEINLNSEQLLPYYYLSRSYERNGLLTEAWDLCGLIEKKVSRFTETNESLSLLIFITLKTYLLLKKGMNKEALYYLPIFGEYIEDQQIFPSNDTKVKFISLYYFTFGCIFQNLGEYDQAFTFYQKSLSLINNNETLFLFSCEIFTKIGEIFFTKGEFFYANENFMTALKLSEKCPNTFAKIEVLLAIAELNFYLENYQESENLFETLYGIEKLITDPNILAKLHFSYFVFQIREKEIKKELLEKNYRQFITNMAKIKNHYTPLANFILFLAKGMYLHKKNALDDIKKAKDLLESFSLYDGVDTKYTIIAKKELCEIYFKEVKYLKKDDSIKKFDNLFNDLLTEAKRDHLYPLLIELFLLQSNFELHLNSNNNIAKAQSYLTLADIISQEKNIKQLTTKIFEEEKKFKEQIERWQVYISSSKNLQAGKSLRQDEYFSELKKVMLMHRPK